MKAATRNHIKATILALAKGALGPKIPAKLILRRNFKHYNRTGIIFIHIPKCAGTSLSRSLYGRSLGHHTAQELHDFDPVTFRKLKSFAVIRDPVQRAFSAWSYAAQRGTDDGWVKDRPEYQHPSFQTFEGFATQWLPLQNPSELDPVFQTQSEYIFDSNGATIVDQMIDLKDLNSLWPSLIANKNVADTQIARLNAQKREGKTKEPISEIARAAIAHYYANDMLLFNRQSEGS